MKDVTVELNVQEMGIIISALQNLENADELRLSHEYGSVSALYNSCLLYTSPSPRD